VMAVLNNGLQLLGVGADLTQIIKGLVLLIAVAFDVYNKSQGKKSIIGMMFKNFGLSSELKADETTSTSQKTETPEHSRDEPVSALK
jgi:putative multiple sugar transport system permease protein